MRRMGPVQSFVICGLLLGAALPAWPQALYNIHFRTSSVAGQPGGTVTLGLGLANNPAPVTGFSFGVKHDATRVAFEPPLVIGPGLQAALGGQGPDADFYFVNPNPAGGAGFTVAMILSRNNASIVLPPAADHHVFDARYNILAGAQGEARVEITGDLGSPKVPVILDRNGVSQLPAGAPGIGVATIAVGGGSTTPFLRGDANQSGRIEVTDSILIFDHLFGGGQLAAGASTRADCLVLYNADGSLAMNDPQAEDEPDIDLTDGVVLLQFLFQRGLPPPAPFPACGQPASPSSARLACTSFVCR